VCSVAQSLRPSTPSPQPLSAVVVGMVSNGFSIADPADPGMLDVVGFDTATPQLISDFARGGLV
jgi:60 kDa SS-A/Ro ribonucleoprotein